MVVSVIDVLDEHSNHVYLLEGELPREDPEHQTTFGIYSSFESAKEAADQVFLRYGLVDEDDWELTSDWTDDLDDEDRDDGVWVRIYDDTEDRTVSYRIVQYVLDDYPEGC